MFLQSFRLLVRR